MTLDEFYKLGFTYEVLPSGRVNIINKTPFLHNGARTICQRSGFYTRTTEYKSVQSLLDNIRELLILGETENDSHSTKRRSVQESVPVSVECKKAKRTTGPKKTDQPDQPLTEAKPTKTRKPRKPKA